MHAFPKLLSPFQGPSQFAALLPQSDKAFQYHNEYRMLRSFVRTLPFEFHQLLVWRQKDPENFDDPVYTVNRGVFFTTVDQTTRRHAFQVFTAFHLAHYKCPERHFHNEILEIDRYTPPF